MIVMDELENKPWYQVLKDEVEDNILVYQDKRGYLWEKVNSEHLRYFKNNCCGYPFTNHLALGLMILSNQNLEPKSIYRYFPKLKCWSQGTISRLKLASVNDFDANTHLSDYLREEILPSHSDNKRSKFFSDYKSMVKKVHKWYQLS